jgi:hypothetical protein
MSKSGFDVLKAMNMMSNVLWVLMLCSSETVQCFERTCRLHLQDQRLCQAKKPAETDDKLFDLQFSL